MDAALHAEPRFHQSAQRLGELDFLGVQVLTRELGKGVDLALQRVIQPPVLVAEIDGRIPHLQIEIRRVVVVKEITAVAAAEDLWRIGVMNGVAVRAVLCVFFEQKLVFQCDPIIVRLDRGMGHSLSSALLRVRSIPGRWSAHHRTTRTVCE